MAATRWKTDLTHADVQFSAKHMMVTTVRGKFADVVGTMTLDEENPSASSGEFTIQAASLTTGVERRDAHLRNEDFFHSDVYPTITFRSTSVESAGIDRYTVTGDLTIRDVTNTFTFDVDFLGFYQGFGGRRAGFHAIGTLNRDAFGLTWNVMLESGAWLVGKDVKLEIDLAMDEVVAETTAPELAMASA